MFDPRDDARDRDGREGGRARVYDKRDRDDDPREGLMRDLDLPRGEERELVVVRDHVYELDGEDSRTLAAVGAFRVVPEHDLDIDHDTLEHHETMMGRSRGRLAVALDLLTDSLALVGQHGVYCRSERFPGKPKLDIALVLEQLDDAKQLVQSAMEELKRT